MIRVFLRTNKRRISHTPFCPLHGIAYGLYALPIIILLHHRRIAEHCTRLDLFLKNGNSLIVAHDPSGPLHRRNFCLDRGVGAGTLDGVLCGGGRVVEDLGCGGHGDHRIVGSGALEKLNGETSGD